MSQTGLKTIFYCREYKKYIYRIMLNSCMQQYIMQRCNGATKYKASLKQIKENP